MNDDIYSKWSKQVAPKYWVSDEPCDIEFASEPWEGQLGFNNIGQVVQYRNGVWELYDN